MGALKLFEIFRAGRHTASNGLTRDYTADEVQYMAAAYSPERRPAPLVLGHPQDQSAAQSFGEVARLTVKAGILYALASVSDALVDAVRAGRYRNVSASFITPHGPGNPVPGAFYLNHVGFLGAHAPGVKGLASPAFSEGGAVVSFSADIPSTFTVTADFKAPAGYTIGEAHRLAVHRAAVQMQRACPALSYCDAVSLTDSVATF